MPDQLYASAGVAVMTIILKDRCHCTASPLRGFIKQSSYKLPYHSTKYLHSFGAAVLSLFIRFTAVLISIALLDSPSPSRPIFLISFLPLSVSQSTPSTLTHTLLACQCISMYIFYHSNLFSVLFILPIILYNVNVTKNHPY